MTLTLTAMRGYPASGKSTKAREIANETGAVVVCRDDLRKMLHGVYFSGKSELEDQVTIAERAQVKGFLENGISVVVDATHLESRYLRKWAKMSAQYGAEFVRVDVTTDVLTCTDRDRKRGDGGGRYVGASVISRMAQRNPINNWPDIQAPPTFDAKPVEWIDGLPEAAIFDIDGTLAHMSGRSPYDYTLVHTDTVDENIRWVARTLFDAGVRIIIVTGRDDECYEATYKWLVLNDIPFHEIHMRPTGAKDNHGNKLPDYLVKYDLFDKNIRGKYNIRAVFDDRDQVVGLWRALGLKCLQVQPGDF